MQSPAFLGAGEGAKHSPPSTLPAHGLTAVNVLSFSSLGIEPPLPTLDFLILTSKCRRTLGSCFLVRAASLLVPAPPPVAEMLPGQFSRDQGWFIPGPGILAPILGLGV